MYAVLSEAGGMRERAGDGGYAVHTDESSHCTTVRTSTGLFPEGEEGWPGVCVYPALLPARARPGRGSRSRATLRPARSHLRTTLFEMKLTVPKAASLLTLAHLGAAAIPNLLLFSRTVGYRHDS